MTTDTIYSVGSGSYSYLEKFEIIELLTGNITTDTILVTLKSQQTISDLYLHENFLLFLKKLKDCQYSIHKNQYVDIYKTKEGRWASHYLYDDYNHPLNVNSKIKPEKLDFMEDISFNLNEYEKEYIQERFPSRFYRVKDNKAFAIYGNFIEDIVKLKMNGIFNEEEELF